MATLATSRVGANVFPKYNVNGVVPETVTYAMTVTSSATDTLQLIEVQAGARVLSVECWADTATLTYSVGDGDKTDRFLSTASGILVPSATSIGALTSVRRIDVGAGLGYSYSAADTIDVKFNAAGGGATTTLYVAISLHYDGQDR